MAVAVSAEGSARVLRDYTANQQQKTTNINANERTRREDEREVSGGVDGLVGGERGGDSVPGFRRRTSSRARDGTAGRDGQTLQHSKHHEQTNGQITEDRPEAAPARQRR